MGCSQYPISHSLNRIYGPSVTKVIYDNTADKGTHSFSEKLLMSDKDLQWDTAVLYIFTFNLGSSEKNRLLLAKLQVLKIKRK